MRTETDEDDRGNQVSGAINHDGRADVSTKERPGRPRDPSIKRSTIRDLTVRTSELLFSSIISRRLSSSSSADVLDAVPKTKQPARTQTGLLKDIFTSIHHESTSNPRLFFQLLIVQRHAKRVRFPLAGSRTYARLHPHSTGQPWAA